MGIGMKIIYEDKHILVCAKPPGLAVQTARVGQQDLISQLKNHLAGSGEKAPYLGVIHRLDQPVEGLLVFGRTKEATAKLSRQLQDGTLRKQYYGVICGIPAVKSGELVDYLEKDSAAGKAEVVTGYMKEKHFMKEGYFMKEEHSRERFPDAKKAVLQYGIVQETTIPFPAALANIRIDTGRFHQIRAQMAHAGMPLMGDHKYAVTEEEHSGEILEISRSAGVKNVALCAYQISFLHPVSGKRMDFEVKPEGEVFSWFL